MTLRRLRGRPTPFKDIRYRRFAATRRSAIEETTAAYVAAKVQVEGHAQGARRGSSASPRRANKGCRQRRGARFRPRGPTPSFQPRIRRCLPAARVARDTARTRYGPPPRDSFMANKMLIDATHPEETRVVVLRGNRVEEFDFESANRRQLRGNIYLAKVTRVEPSLQAAFVDYGGNRHGFLAFSEIHPDYYQIPVADRQALIAEEERAHRDAEDEIDRRASGGGRNRRPRREQTHEQDARTRRARSEAAEAPDDSRTGEHDGERAEAMAAPSDIATAEQPEACDITSSDAARADNASAEQAIRRRAGRSSGRAAGRRDGPEQRACATAQTGEPAPEPKRSMRRNTATITRRMAAAATDGSAGSRRSTDRRGRGSARRQRRKQHRRSRTSRALGRERRGRGRVGRRRRRDGRSAGAHAALPPLIQDPGSDQAPADHAGAGGQGRARHQGRGADHLSLARRPLFGADAEHRARRRHQPQDHQRARPQAAQGDRAGARSAGRHGRDPAHRRRRAAPRPRSSATSNTCCGCGRRCATSR